MSTPVVYPAHLPTPQTGPVRPAERRVVARPPGLFETRTAQTDRLETQECQFTLSPSEALDWHAWWRDTLLRGSCLFGATWHLPRGKVPAVRQFMGPPDWRFISRGKPDEGGYWVVTATFEVFDGEPPVIRDLALFLLHYDGNLTDSAAGHLFEADTIIVDAAPNSFTYSSDDPLFGQAQNGRCPGTNNHIRSEPFPDLQLASYDWQVEGFVKPRELFSAVGGAVICTGSLQSGGNTVGPSPEAGQFAIEISTLGDWIVEYSDALGSDNPIELLDPASAQEEWNYFLLQSDAESFRFFAGPVSAPTAPKIMETVGVRPFAGAYDSLQRFFIAARYAGGTPPLEAYTNRFHGDYQDFRMVLGFLTPLVGGEAPIPVTSLSARV